MFTLDENEDGITEYMGVRAHGRFPIDKEKIFIKAKGALYIDDLRERRNERITSFVTGLFAGLLITLFSHVIK